MGEKFTEREGTKFNLGLGSGGGGGDLLKGRKLSLGLGRGGGDLKAPTQKSLI